MAAGDLFRQYRDRLLRMIAFRLDGRLLGKVDCEDVLQDAFVETVRRIGDYRRRPSVPVFIWLRQITAQVLIDTHRRYLGARMRDVNREVSAFRIGIGRRELGLPGGPTGRQPHLAQPGRPCATSRWPS